MLIHPFIYLVISHSQLFILFSFNLFCLTNFPYFLYIVLFFLFLCLFRGVGFLFSLPKLPFPLSSSSWETSFSFTRCRIFVFSFSHSIFLSLVFYSYFVRRKILSLEILFLHFHKYFFNGREKVQNIKIYFKHDRLVLFYLLPS